MFYSQTHALPVAFLKCVNALVSSREPEVTYADGTKQEVASTQDVNGKNIYIRFNYEYMSTNKHITEILN